MTTEEKKAKALADWPVPIHPRLGLGPTEKDIGVWFVRHRETLLSVLAPAEVTQPSKPYGYEGSHPNGHISLLIWKDTDDLDEAKKDGIIFKPLYDHPPANKANEEQLCAERTQANERILSLNNTICKQSQDLFELRQASEILLAELKKCEQTFAHYADLHSTKGTRDGDEKAAANLNHANRIAVLILQNKVGK